VNEVVIPRTPDGQRSNAALGRATVADALRARIRRRPRPAATATGGAVTGAVALSHRAILTPQIFRHETEDRRQGNHQSRFSADNRTAFVPIF
jgi:sugar (pentulose or hexulose) kinase